MPIITWVYGMAKKHTIKKPSNASLMHYNLLLHIRHPRKSQKIPSFLRGNLYIIWPSVDTQ